MCRFLLLMPRKKRYEYIIQIVDKVDVGPLINRGS